LGLESGCINSQTVTQTEANSTTSAEIRKLVSPVIYDLIFI